MIVGEMEFEKTVAVGEDIECFIAERDANDRPGNFDGIEAAISGEDVTPHAFFMFFAFVRSGGGRLGIEIGGWAFTFAEDAAFEVKFFEVAEAAIGEDLDAIEGAGAFAEMISERVEAIFKLSPNAADAIRPTRHGRKLRRKMGKGKVRFSLTGRRV
jgi:hypothetical protein